LTDDDPQERYFRPRPAKPEGPGDAEPVEGVSIGGSGASHVKVERRVDPRGARRQRFFLVAAGVLSAGVLLVSGGGWAFQDYVLGSVKRVNAFDGLKNRPGSGPKGSMNILLAGVDRREGLTGAQIRNLHLGKVGGQRSDTMMLVHISSRHDKVTVVSLPRDSLVTIPEHRSNGAEGARGARIGARQGKLNWAYMYGGANLTVQTVEDATGVHIDHYVEVNFLGFLRVVDALGGVTICTDQPINDPKSGLRLPAGKSNVDGPSALAYARARYTLTGGSDLGRIDRQQQFMSAVVHKALSDPARFPGVLSAGLRAIRADKGLSKGTLSSLATQMRGIGTDGVSFATVPLADANHMTPLGGGPPQSTVLWDRAGGGQLFREIKKDQPIVAPPKPTPSGSGGGLTVPPDQINVRVVNGVGTVGLAAKAAQDLRQAGFGTTVVPGARRGARSTVVQYGPGREDSARTLRAAIPGARLKPVPSLGSRLQVVVGPSWDGARRPKVAPSPGSTSQQVNARTATQNLCD
jgi:LCP family protein required for cell wall assembly